MASGGGVRHVLPALPKIQPKLVKRRRKVEELEYELEEDAEDPSQLLGATGTVTDQDRTVSVVGRGERRWA